MTLYKPAAAQLRGMKYLYIKQALFTEDEGETFSRHWGMSTKSPCSA